MGGWTYCQARPNANLCNGGAWVWDDSASFSWELLYHADYAGLRLPARSERDMRDFEWPNGVHVTMVEPLTKYEVRYEDPDQLEVNLEFDAIMAPNPHPVGVAPFFTGGAFRSARTCDRRDHPSGRTDLRRLPIVSGPVLGAPPQGATKASAGVAREESESVRRCWLFLWRGGCKECLARVLRPRPRFGPCRMRLSPAGW